MNHKRHPGFFDRAERTAKLTEMGDPLVGLNGQINWEVFRPDLNRVHEKERKSNAGARLKPTGLLKIYAALKRREIKSHF